MTNQQILEIAMKQSAIDSNCCWQDFTSRQNKVVISAKNENARKYLKLPFICDLTSYGTNIVASVSKELEETVRKYINKYKTEHCFETPNLHKLMNSIHPMGYNICFMAEYSLPDTDILAGGKLADKLWKRVSSTSPSYEIRLMGQGDFKELYIPQWGNALCKERKDLDVIAAGIYDKGKLAALAGASADCSTMWQIGVDVLPDYRRQGLASALTSRLATEILNKGIVPFYCCAWSNVGSIRNAVASGFRPAWVQITAKTTEEIEEMNSEE
ncbi:MAG: GNAT family N-acetyltransferase [Lachnospiraceae bacterium]|nr:GNAT family N-acetyltransferase [Lachnospiraceae bacterium]